MKLGRSLLVVVIHINETGIVYRLLQQDITPFHKLIVIGSPDHELDGIAAGADSARKERLHLQRGNPRKFFAQFRRNLHRGAFASGPFFQLQHGEAAVHRPLTVAKGGHDDHHRGPLPRFDNRINGIHHLDRRIIHRIEIGSLGRLHTDIDRGAILLRLIFGGETLPAPRHQYADGKMQAVKNLKRATKRSILS